MAQDSSLINGVSTESLGPYTDAFFALFGGLAIGFYYCWQESLITLGCVPFIILSQWLGMEFQKGLTNENKDLNSAADLLCGDSIINYKTVQSLAHEDRMLRKYREYLEPVAARNRKHHVKAGFAFGISQCVVYCVFAALFYFGGLLIEYSKDENTGKYGLDPENVFIAIFAIFFGASQAGTAMSMGPDVGKA